MRLPLLSCVVLSAVLGWGSLVQLRSETWWWVAVLDSIPPQLWLVVPLLLGWISFRTRQWDLTLLNLGSVICLLCGPTGFVLPHVSPALPGLPLKVITLNADFASAPAEVVAGMTRREGVDVIVLQEALNQARQDVAYESALRRAFPGWALRRHDELITLSRLPILNSRVQNFPNSPHAVLISEILISGRVVTVINTHLPTLALLPSQSDFQQHRTLMQRVKRQLSFRRDFLRVTSGILSDAQGAVVLAGDFNAPPRGELHARLTSQGWTDAFQQAGTGFGFTHHARFGHSRIDYLWLHGLSAASVRVLPDVLSDHRAVISLLRLN